MIMRICPVCSTKWYGSERQGKLNWTCEKCGTVMSKEDNQPPEEVGG